MEDLSPLLLLSEGYAFLQWQTEGGGHGCEARGAGGERARQLTGGARLMWAAGACCSRQPGDDDGSGDHFCCHLT
ncbi:unnamed protein product [Parnassius apollo]|uniref:(apollo) hypothetical protein n=1 Tax=Parnassius apollo TaxID=110799 RepID=A0A8S3W4P4_PARAO|nr:unnamed protein product [Parnassius apollo]